METITNIAATAKQAIFGDQTTATQQNETAGQEPISGQQGQGTTNEPFDKGNSDDPITGDTKHHHESTEQPIIGDSNKAPSSIPETVIPPNVASGLPTHNATQGSTEHHHETADKPLVGDSSKAPTSLPESIIPSQDSHQSSDKTQRVGAGIYSADSTPTAASSKMSETNKSATEVSDAHKNSPEPLPFRSVSDRAAAETANDAATDPHVSTDKTGVVSDRMDPPKAHDVLPTERAANAGGAPESDATTGVKHQGADAPTDAPKGEQESAVKSQKDKAEDVMKNRDPNDHSGEPMKMHDGPEKPALTQEERRTSKAGNPGGQEHGKDPKGTGEEWVKTSGMAADGGDFDATKPGAGREADRLMEEKGIHKTTSDHAPPPASEGTTSPSTADHKEKVSMKDKIKDKLHLGHKH